jgi:phosphatidylglycerol:prolipoprotein diacylglycerol transferase
MFPLAKTALLGIPLMLWIYLLGFVTHGALVSLRWLRQGISGIQCVGICALVMVLSILGGKTYALIDSWAYYSNHPTKLIAFGGHGWTGAFTAAVLGLTVLFLAWRKPVLKLLDTFVLYLPIGISIGRIGCLLTADGDYGTPTTLPWGMTFEYGYFPTQVPVHPTPLYEILVMALLFFAMRFLIVDKKAHGWVLVTYLLVYSSERFLMEFIRLNKVFAMGLTLPQWACIGYAVAGLSIATVLLQRARRSTRSYS